VPWPACMRHDKNRVIVPPVPDRMFPQREFPPYVALDLVRRSLAAAIERQGAGAPALDRLQAPLGRMAGRLISMAQGHLQPHRWYRRLVTSARMCRRAKLALADYVRRGALTSAEAGIIGRGLDQLLERLEEASDLSDEIRIVLSSELSPPSEPV
jgi:hypothetical protein